MAIGLRSTTRRNNNLLFQYFWFSRLFGLPYPVTNRKIYLPSPELEICISIKIFSFADRLYPPAVKHIHHIKGNRALSFQHIFACGKVGIEQIFALPLYCFLRRFII